MFAKLTGTIDTIRQATAIIDVSGVGYLTHCSGRTLGQMTKNQTVSLIIETQVREDAIILYGFTSETERDWFKLLNSVQGVGGKHALSLLTVLSPEDLTTAIAALDKKILTRADGVGPKLAERIVNELKSKVGSIMAAHMDVPLPANTDMPGTSSANDAISALVNLGFGRTEAFTVVHRLTTQMGGDATVQTLISAGLKELSA